MRLTLQFLFCVVYNIEANKNVLRIAGGRNASQDEFPFVVKIVLQKSNDAQLNHLLCSSVVVTSIWTLTTAQCAVNVKYNLISNSETQDKVMIAYHSSRKSGSESFSEVLSSVPHPNSNQGENDIGLLHTQPLIFAKYGKLSSIDYKTLTGQKVALVGYGLLNELKNYYLELPQVLEVIVKECSDVDLYPNLCFAPPCSVEKYKSKALCKGDSGGPSVHASGVVAISSKIDPLNCGTFDNRYLRRDRYDTGYDIGLATPISPFLDWISNVIKSDII